MKPDPAKKHYSGSLEEFRRQLWTARYGGLWPKDWATEDFTVLKAYICALFSKLAYCHIPELELRNHGGIKVVPCVTYQRLIAQKQSDALRHLITVAELPTQDPIVITSDFLVAVGIVLPDVVIVSMRGTRPFYLRDWAIDFDALVHAKVAVDGRTDRFHRGFFEAIASQFGQIGEAIRQRAGPRPGPIYATGHSLGGAMAAVFNSLNLRPCRYRGVQLPVTPKVRSCYTFGMPRYGNGSVVSKLPCAHRILNALDVVPSVPPRLFGYADSLPQHVLTGDGKIHPARPEVSALLALVSRADRLRAVRHHLMERYVKRLETLAHAYVAAGGPKHP